MRPWLEGELILVFCDEICSRQYPHISHSFPCVYGCVCGCVYGCVNVSFLIWI
eukprot:m.94026 g.94026  ORF g.94026 m.94026 type:complete len:53 (-) comp13015_c0_seq1:617-775(-)